MGGRRASAAWVRFDAAVSAALRYNCCCFYDRAGGPFVSRLAPSPHGLSSRWRVARASHVTLRPAIATRFTLLRGILPLMKLGRVDGASYSPARAPGPRRRAQGPRGQRSKKEEPPRYGPFPREWNTAHVFCCGCCATRATYDPPSCKAIELQLCLLPKRLHVIDPTAPSTHRPSARLEARSSITWFGDFLR